MRADTSVEADVERLFDVAEERLGAVTGLVNNAAVTGPLGRLADSDTADLRRVLDVNLLGGWMSAAAVSRRRGTVYSRSVDRVALSRRCPTWRVSTHVLAYSPTVVAPSRRVM
ncbi:hypothetical protein STENM36S_03537 [Streptomyces tendae]